MSNLKAMLQKAEERAHTIDRSHQIASAKRELMMRKRVYPGWVAQGRMEESEAVWELACTMAIIKTLEGDLF